MTIADVMEQTLRKRALRSNLEYVVELYGHIGHELDPKIEVSVLEGQQYGDEEDDEDIDGAPLEFLLVQKHSTLCAAGIGAI